LKQFLFLFLLITVCSSLNVDVLVFEAQNYKSKTSDLDIEWSLISSRSNRAGIEKYAILWIKTVLAQRSFLLDPAFENLYAVVGAPKIEVSFKFKSDGDIYSGQLKYQLNVFPRKSDLNLFYEKSFGSIEVAFEMGAIPTIQILPWSTTVYFVGSHEMSGFWP
jgi:hypothetical protein